MKFDWRRKLSNRKFWAAVADVIISVMVTFNVDAVTQELFLRQVLLRFICLPRVQRIKPQ